MTCALLGQQQHTFVFGPCPLSRFSCNKMHCSRCRKNCVSCRAGTLRLAAHSSQGCSLAARQRRKSQTLQVLAISTKSKTLRSTTRQPFGTGKKAGFTLENASFWDRFYPNITGFPFPLGPLFSRQTIRYEVEPGSIWVFEQEQSLALSGVNTIIRMTAVRLSSGRLLVYSPVAPTSECINLVKDLQLPVQYIVLSTFAYEHKIYIPPFSRAFPDAEVWVAPGQWSAPLPLPLPFLGIFPSGVLTDDDTATPWDVDLEHKVLCSSVGIQPYSEVAFFHKATKTLLVTDAVVFVPKSPPEVVDDKSLYGAGGDLPALVLKFSNGEADKPSNKLNPPPSDEGQRKLRGWRRNTLNVLYIKPSNLLFPDDSFEAITERLFVSPILKLLVFSKAPQATRRWVDSIATNWNFNKIIPAHFDAPVKSSPREFRAAFNFLDEALAGSAVSEIEEPVPSPGFFGRLFGGLRKRTPLDPGRGSAFPEADIAALKSTEQFLKKVGVLNKF